MIKVLERGFEKIYLDRRAAAGEARLQTVSQIRMMKKVERNVIASDMFRRDPSRADKQVT